MTNKHNFGGIIKVVYSKTQHFTIVLSGYQTTMKDMDSVFSKRYPRPIHKVCIDSQIEEDIIGCVQWALDRSKINWKHKREIKPNRFVYSLNFARNVSAVLGSPFWMADLVWIADDKVGVDWVSSNYSRPVDETIFLNHANAIKGLATTICVSDEDFLSVTFS